MDQGLWKTQGRPSGGARPRPQRRPRHPEATPTQPSRSSPWRFWRIPRKSSPCLSPAGPPYISQAPALWRCPRRSRSGLLVGYNVRHGCPEPKAHIKVAAFPDPHPLPDPPTSLPLGLPWFPGPGLLSSIWTSHPSCLAPGTISLHSSDGHSASCQSRGKPTLKVPQLPSPLSSLLASSAASLVSVRQSSPVAPLVCPQRVVLTQ